MVRIGEASCGVALAWLTGYAGIALVRFSLLRLEKVWLMGEVLAGIGNVR